MSGSRILETAKTGRAKCKGCKETIAKGAFRFGTEVDLEGHTSTAWKHVQCITKRQANNLAQLAEDEGQSVSELMTFGTGAEGDDVQSAFVALIEALRNDATPDMTLFGDVEVVPPSAKKARTAKPKKTGFDALKVKELKALCKENGLPVSGNKSQLIERLRDEGVKEDKE